MKKRGGGKAKGGAFERWVCRVLSEWITKGKRDDVFWRSSISGGRATVGKRKGKDLAHVAGDICAVREEGMAFASEFFVECKHYRDLSLHRFLLSEGKLWEFWEMACAQATRHRKHPVLICKQAGGLPELVLMLKRDIGRLCFPPESVHALLLPQTCVLTLERFTRYAKHHSMFGPPSHNTAKRRV